MHKISTIAAYCVAFTAFMLSTDISAHAQTGTPSLPPGPLPPAPAGPLGGIAAENFLATSAANEHGAYLWIVAPVQHVVVLCEKLEQTKEFTCTTKRLP